MSFEIVQCEVIWVASVEALDGSGNPSSRHTKLGDFEDKGDACRALAEYGLTLDEFGWWTGNYMLGTVTRTLKEIR